MKMHIYLIGSLRLTPLKTVKRFAFTKIEKKCQNEFYCRKMKQEGINKKEIKTKELVGTDELKCPDKLPVFSVLKFHFLFNTGH